MIAIEYGTRNISWVLVNVCACENIESVRFMFAQDVNPSCSSYLRKLICTSADDGCTNAHLHKKYHRKVVIQLLCKAAKNWVYLKYNLLNYQSSIFHTYQSNCNVPDVLTIVISLVACPRLLQKNHVPTDATIELQYGQPIE